jgi:capsid assembly protease
MHDLPRVASRLFGTPLMVARPKLDTILRAIGPRLLGLDVAAEARPSDRSGAGYHLVGSVAVVPIVGTLVSRAGWLDAASGLTSYAEVADRIVAAAEDSAARGVLLEIDSSGGEVGGLFDLVDRIGAIRSGSGKPIWTVASEAALSAAYAITCATDRIYVTQTGEVGSVGVVAVHVDESGADAQAGLAWTFIHAGERKVDGNPHEPLSDRARTDLQADIDRLYARFVALVAASRKMAAKAVAATEAGIYRGDLAVSAGLADQVGTLADAIAAMEATFKPPARWPALTPGGHRMDPHVDQPERPEAATDHVAAPAASAIAAAVGEQVRQELAELASIAAQAGRLGITVDAADALGKGIKPDALRRAVLEELAARSDAAQVVAHTQGKQAGESPIVRRARERASVQR